MFEFEGTWFPDGEKHLLEWLRKKRLPKIDGHLVYQYHKYTEAMEFVDTTKMAIDIGAHIGMWTRAMAMDFEHVHAFEPVSMFRECWVKNMEGFTNASLFSVALGSASGSVSFHNPTPGSFGNTRIGTDEEDAIEVDVPMTTLSTYNFEDVGFIKIDCEGFEYQVLEGAEKTLVENKPCVIVEQKPDRPQTFGHDQLAGVKYLEHLGAKLRKKIAGDYILSWD